jgi:thioredoxin-related protein
MFRYLFAFFLIHTFLSASQLHWLGDYGYALEKARKERKVLLVLVVKEACPLCGEVIRDVFAGQPYLQTLQAKTVPVLVTYRDVVQYPVEMYWTNCFPALFVVESSRELFLNHPLCGEAIDTERVSKIVDRL